MPLAGQLGPLGVATRRKAAWTPAELSPAHWIKGDDLTGADGSNVTSWPDASGNGVPATVQGVWSPPTVKAAGLNGLPVLAMTSTQGLRAFHGAALIQPYSFFAVARATSGSSGRIIGGDLSIMNSLMGWHGGLKDVAFIDGWVATGGPHADTNWAGYSLVANLSGTVFRRDSSHIGTGGVTVGPGSLALNGYSVGTMAEGSNAEVAEVLTFSAALADSDRQKVEGYLAHKWGRTAELPAAHPYKTEAP